MYQVIYSRVGGERGYQVREEQLEDEKEAMERARAHVTNRERGVGKKACIICPDGMKIIFEA